MGLSSPIGGDCVHYYGSVDIITSMIFHQRIRVICDVPGEPPKAIETPHTAEVSSPTIGNLMGKDSPVGEGILP